MLEVIYHSGAKFGFTIRYLWKILYRQYNNSNILNKQNITTTPHVLFNLLIGSVQRKIPVNRPHCQSKVHSIGTHSCVNGNQMECAYSKTATVSVKTIHWNQNNKKTGPRLKNDKTMSDSKEDTIISSDKRA